MHDIKAIREDRVTRSCRAPDSAAALAEAGALADDLLAQDKALRELLTRLQTSQARRNDASKLIGQAKQKKDEAQAKALMDEVAGLKDEIQRGEGEQREREEVRSKQALAVIPNIPAADTPDGADEGANVPVAARAFGKPPGINNPKQHFRDRRGAGPDGFRTRRQGIRRPVCLSQGRSGAPGTRHRRLHAGHAYGDVRLYRSGAPGAGAWKSARCTGLGSY